MPPTILTSLRSQVHNLDGDCCAYCKTPESLTVTVFEVDHIVPVSAGGEARLDNLCLACPACNRSKGARQSAPDPETGRDTPLYHPRRQIWTEHFAWNRDASQLVGLTPTGRATVGALRMNRPPMVRLRKLWAKVGRFPPR